METNWFLLLATLSDLVTQSLGSLKFYLGDPQRPTVECMKKIFKGNITATHIDLHRLLAHALIFQRLWRLQQPHRLYGDQALALGIQDLRLNQMGFRVWDSGTGWSFDQVSCGYFIQNCFIFRLLKVIHTVHVLNGDRKPTFQCLKRRT